MPAHSATDLAALYENRFAGKTDYRRKVWKVLTRSFFSRWVAPDASVLDLGCGYCEFINQIQARAKVGMDLNPEARFRAAADVQVIEQDCAETWPLADNALDAVFTSNFFEHLPGKPQLERTLEEVHRCLRPGGHLIAVGPNIKYVPGAYWDFFDHYLPLTELSLAEVLRKLGFELAVCTGRFLPYTMARGPEYPLWMLRLYLAMPVLWRFFGKQFLVVGRKPSATRLVADNR